MVDVTINYLAVLVAAVAGMVIGAFWYSPLLFGNIWVKLMNFDKKKMEETKNKGMAKYYALAFLAVLVMSYILAHFVDYAGATNLVQALQLGFWVWLGFFVTTMLNSVLWEGKPVKLYLIGIVHYLVALEVMSLILTLWV